MRRESSSGITLVELGPLLLLAATAVYLHFQWDQIPTSFPIHWGLHGPDRWVARSPRTVYGFLLLSATACGALLITCYGLIRWTRTATAGGPEAERELRFRQAACRPLVAIQYLLVVLTWLTLFPWRAEFSRTAMNIWAALLLITVGATLVSLIRMSLERSRRRMSLGAPDAGWKWCIFYVNPGDSALFVEKRFGIGYTLNFGNRWSWVVLAVMLAPAAVAICLLR
jgi:uncharacterized membrane protein